MRNILPVLPLSRSPALPLSRSPAPPLSRSPTLPLSRSLWPGFSLPLELSIRALSHDALNSLLELLLQPGIEFY
jgi:hypothetical protein